MILELHRGIASDVTLIMEYYEAVSVEGMKFIPVESRMILGVRYNRATLEMDVVFRTGEKYRYKAVPQSVFEELMSAESHGQYMHKRVLGRYDYQRLA